MKREAWKKVGTVLLSVLYVVWMPFLSEAQEYPTKPVNFLLSFGAGGSLDISTRVLASKAETFLGQPFIISNNGAGGGSVALGIVAKERPDGYRLVGCTVTGLVQIPQLRGVPYKKEDFVPIMHFGEPQSGTMVRGDAPWETVKELVEYARKNPGAVSYSTSGVGGQGHMAMEYVAKQEGIKWTHVPYPGNAPALTALLGGHVTALSAGPEAIPHIKEGKLRLLATHGEKRMKTFPDVPTFRELGYDFIAVVRFMIAAPKGTPPPIVRKLDEVFRKAMDDPRFLETMAKMEIEPSYRNSEDTRKFLEEAYARIEKMITYLGITKEAEKK